MGLLPLMEGNYSVKLQGNKLEAPKERHNDAAALIVAQPPTRIIRVYNPSIGKIKSYRCSSQTATIGSSTGADLQISLPSLLPEHIVVDFDGKVFTVHGPDVLCDNNLVPIGATVSFSDTTVVKLRSLVIGFYTTSENKEQCIQCIKDAVMGKEQKSEEDSAKRAKTSEKTFTEAYLEKKIEKIDEEINDAITVDTDATVEKKKHPDLRKAVMERDMLEQAKEELKKDEEEKIAEIKEDVMKEVKDNIKEEIREDMNELVQEEVRGVINEAVAECLNSSVDAIVDQVKSKIEEVKAEEKIEEPVKPEKEEPAKPVRRGRKKKEEPVKDEKVEEAAEEEKPIRRGRSKKVTEVIAEEPVKPLRGRRGKKVEEPVKEEKTEEVPANGGRVRRKAASAVKKALEKKKSF